MAYEIQSPRADIAAERVLIVQVAQTQIKELIVQAYNDGWSKAILETKIAQVIANVAVKMPGTVVTDIQRGLAFSAQRWEYDYKSSMTALTAATLSSIDYNQPRIREGAILVAKTFSLSVGDVVRGNVPPNLQKEIISNMRNYVTSDTAGRPLILDYEKRVRNVTKILAADPAWVTRVDKNGKVYKPNLRNFAEMTVRYEQNQADVGELKKTGTKYVWTSSHADCSGRCAPFQGRLWSLDGSSGTLDGNKYEPIEVATAGIRGDGNGCTSGYNCRHRLIQYTPGSKAPPVQPAPKDNAINERQRRYEREIRYNKTQERLARKNGDKAEAERFNKAWKDLDKEYAAFSWENKRPYELWRTQVSENEVRYAGGLPVLPPPGALSPLDPTPYRGSNPPIVVPPAPPIIQAPPIAPTVSSNPAGQTIINSGTPVVPQPAPINLNYKSTWMGKYKPFVNFAKVDTSAAPEKIRKLYEAMGNRSPVGVTSGTTYKGYAVSYYSTGAVDKITVPAADTPMAKNTTAHELGHLIHLSAKAPNGRPIQFECAQDIAKAIRTDLGMDPNDRTSPRRPAEIAFASTIPQPFTDRIAKGNSLGASALAEWKKTASIRRKEIEQEYLNKGADAYTAYKKSLKDLDKEAQDAYYGATQDDEIQFDHHLSDMFDAVSGGVCMDMPTLSKLNWGHGIKYYNAAQDSRGAELFANYMALNIYGAQDRLDEFAAKCPATYSALQKIADDVYQANIREGWIK